MEPLGFVALPKTRRVRLQQRGSDEGVALPVISMDGADVRMGNTRLSGGRVRCLWTFLCHGGGSFAETSGARLRTGSGGAVSLVLSHFPHRILLAHRIYGIALPRIPACFTPLRAERTLVDGRIIRCPLLDDTPNRCCLVADPRDRGSASVLGNE